jgi:hypothetical protein
MGKKKVLVSYGVDIDVRPYVYVMGGAKFY